MLENVTGALAEIERLNKNLEELVEILADLRTMAAPALGWRVTPTRTDPRD